MTRKRVTAPCASNCGREIVLRPDRRTDLCHPCAMARGRKPVEMRACAKPDCKNSFRMYPGRKSPYCKPCTASAIATSPSRNAAMSATLRARHSDPDFAARHRARTAQAGRTKRQNEALMARLRESGRRLGMSAKGRTYPPDMPSRRAGTRKMVETKLGWCPIEYRAEYRRIARMTGIDAAAARKMVEEMIAADARHYERTGELRQSARLEARS